MAPSHSVEWSRHGLIASGVDASDWLRLWSHTDALVAKQVEIVHLWEVQVLLWVGGGHMQALLPEVGDSVSMRKGSDGAGRMEMFRSTCSEHCRSQRVNSGFWCFGVIFMMGTVNLLEEFIGSYQVQIAGISVGRRLERIRV